MSCSGCRQLRQELGEAITERKPVAVIKVIRKAVYLNVDKIVLGKEEAIAKYERENPTS